MKIKKNKKTLIIISIIIIVIFIGIIGGSTPPAEEEAQDTKILISEALPTPSEKIEASTEIQTINLYSNHQTTIENNDEETETKNIDIIPSEDLVNKIEDIPEEEVIIEEETAAEEEALIEEEKTIEEEPIRTYLYILNTETGKFHLSSCSYANKINEENRAECVDTRENLIAMGYEPCGRCNP